MQDSGGNIWLFVGRAVVNTRVDSLNSSRQPSVQMILMG